jgi:phosphohistidine swiveling domain-containing protein
MKRFLWDQNKFGLEESTPTSRAFHHSTRALVRERFEASGLEWKDFVFGKSQCGVSEADFAEVKDGRMKVGEGDNVVTYPASVKGSALYVHTTDEVMTMVMEGVPSGSIAIIDDSGGTLTAPILEHFAAVICMGGSVRSHLSILCREYGIPCFMNAKVGGINNGDKLEMNCAAPAKSALDCQTGVERTADIWKLV